MYPVLRQRNFRLLLVGGFVSNAGDELLALALPFYVYEHTQSALAGALVFILHILPQVLLGSVAGVFVDRWDRRRAMLVADVVRAVLILLLFPLAFFPVWLWLAYPIVALEAAVSQFFRPAKGSLLPQLVADDELLPANSLFTVSDSAVRLLVPALGGILFAAFGLASVVVIDGASYLFSALLLVFLLVPKMKCQEEGDDVVDVAASRWTGFWTDWREGVRYVAADSLLRVILLVTGLASLASGVINPLLQVWVLNDLHAGADVLGLMTSATGLGILVVGLLLGRLSFGPRLGIVAACGQTLFGFVLVVTFLARSVPLVIALSALAGFAMATSVGFGTLVQARSNDRFRGRVLGANSTTRAFLMVLGEIGGTLLVGPIGLLSVLETACGILILGGTLGIVLLSRVAALTPATAEV